MGRRVKCALQPQNALFHVKLLWVRTLNGIDRSVNFPFWEFYLPKSGSFSGCSQAVPSWGINKSLLSKSLSTSTFVRHWIHFFKSAKRIHCQTKDDFNFLKGNLAYRLLWIIISAMCSFWITNYCYREKSYIIHSISISR